MRTFIAGEKAFWILGASRSKKKVGKPSSASATEDQNLKDKKTNSVRCRGGWKTDRKKNAKRARGNRFLERSDRTNGPVGELHRRSFGHG